MNEDERGKTIQKLVLALKNVHHTDVKPIDSWSSKQLFGNVKGLREAIIERYDNYVDGQNAIIMFNVPFYQIVVNKLSKQYIHPHYKINDIPVTYTKYESRN